jgi:hypothetical protein
MGKSGWRVKLENGLKLDLNRLAKRGFVRPGASTGPISISWTHSYWGHVGSGLISADMGGPSEGFVEIRLGPDEPTYSFGATTPSLWRRPMVLHLSCQESSRLSPLAATRCNAVLQ